MLGKMGFVLRAVSFILVCEIVSFRTNAQFIQQPTPTLALDPSRNTLAALECGYNKDNDGDVIGWVVGTTRISDENALDTSPLGTGVAGQMALSLTGDGPYVYGLDFFNPSPGVSGEYKCQLCTNDGADGCGTVIAESDVSNVQVYYEPTLPPTCLPSSETSARVVFGASVTLSCASEPGLPVVTLEWLRDSAVVSDQAVVMNGVLYNNYTYTPLATDTGLKFTCRVQSSSSVDSSCTAASLFMVSTPTVGIQPPNTEGIPVGSSATYTCSATSPTNTAISSYSWTVEDVPSSRLDTDENVITIRDVTIGDHGKTIQCQATDAENMVGSSQYLILVAGEVVPSGLPTLPPVVTDPVTAPSPGTTEASTGALPLAAIIVIVVVGVILLCILLGGIWFFCNKRKHQKHIPQQTVVKNNLSPNSATHFSNEKAFTYPNVDPNTHDPDVIPKGMNERPVDVKAQWRETGPPSEYSPTIKSVNMPFQSNGSKTNLNHDPYNYNPTYDDKVDPADLDFKPPLDDQDYSDSGIVYRDGDNGYPDEKFGKQYNDGYDDRQYGDGHQDPYSQDYGDPYSGDQGNYGRVYDDDYQSAPAQYVSGYDAYPDRMPDGSEGYDPAPEEYNDQAYNGYNRNPPSDYGRISDYGAPVDYNNDQPADYAYNDQPVGYDDRPAEADYQPSGQDYQAPQDYPVPQDNYDNDPQQVYSDQLQDSYYPNRVPDGGIPENYDNGYPAENDSYNDGYGTHNSHYDDGANYSAPTGQHEAYYDPSFEQPYHSPAQAHSQPYIELEDEVAATSNPSYV